MGDMAVCANSQIDPNTVLSGVPRSHRTPLITAFQNVVKNFREQRWEPAELNGGKLSEIVYSILHGHISGRFSPRPLKPQNFLDACRTLEQGDAAKFSRSVRIQIPRMLIALYEIRNNRGVGHVGGDIDPNHMDAIAVLSMSKWIVAELVRIFNATDSATATATVEGLLERTTPVVWQINGRYRVLDSSLSYKDQMLLLLYTAVGPVAERELVDWLEHSNPTVFRRDVLRKAHKARLIDYDGRMGRVGISPLGIRYVEENLPLDI